MKKLNKKIYFLLIAFFLFCLFAIIFISCNKSNNKIVKKDSPKVKSFKKAIDRDIALLEAIVPKKDEHEDVNMNRFTPSSREYLIKKDYHYRDRSSKERIYPENKRGDRLNATYKLFYPDLGIILKGYDNDYSYSWEYDKNNYSNRMKIINKLKELRENPQQKISNYSQYVSVVLTVDNQNNNYFKNNRYSNNKSYFVEMQRLPDPTINKGLFKIRDPENDFVFINDQMSDYYNTYRIKKYKDEHNGPKHIITTRSGSTYNNDRGGSLTRLKYKLTLERTSIDYPFDKIGFSIKRVLKDNYDTYDKGLISDLDIHMMEIDGKETPVVDIIPIDQSEHLSFTDYHDEYSSRDVYEPYSLDRLKVDIYPIHNSRLDGRKCYRFIPLVHDVIEKSDFEREYDYETGNEFNR